LFGKESIMWMKKSDPEQLETSVVECRTPQDEKLLDDKRSVGGAKDQFTRNCGSVVVAAVAAACSGS